MEVKFARSKSVRIEWNPEIEQQEGVWKRLRDAVGADIAAEIIAAGTHVWRAKVYRDGKIEAKALPDIPGTSAPSPAPPASAPPGSKPIQLPLFPDDDTG